MVATSKEPSPVASSWKGRAGSTIRESADRADLSVQCQGGAKVGREERGEREREREREIERENDSEREGVEEETTNKLKNKW